MNERDIQKSFPNQTTIESGKFTKQDDWTKPQVLINEKNSFDDSNCFHPYLLDLLPFETANGISAKLYSYNVRQPLLSAIDLPTVKFLSKGDGYRCVVTPLG